MSKIIKKKLKIDGMHCNSCVMNIEFNLEDIDGVKSARANLVKAECEVEFEKGKVNEQMIIQTIQETGYKAQIKNE